MPAHPAVPGNIQAPQSEELLSTEGAVITYLVLSAAALKSRISKQVQALPPS